MVKIHLHNLKFFAFHGIHEEERIVGCNYEVSIDITSTFSKGILTVKDTIDYTQVFAIVKKNMDHPTPLLENLADRLCEDLYQRYNNISEIKISIFKSDPPIPQFQGKAGISLTKNFSG
ncbi:MAG: dihydroneopterin aldolase [Bacteroidota bacterium]